VGIVVNSQRLRSRPCNAIDRSTTQRWTPRPEPCCVPPLAITGLIPNSGPGRRCLSWSYRYRVDLRCMRARSAGTAAYLRDGNDQRRQLGYVGTLATVSDTSSRIACPE
jgi:hypothetical protein